MACGRAAHARVYEHFTDEIALASLEAVYRELLGRGEGKRSVSSP
jgi:hypothetical protein